MTSENLTVEWIDSHREAKCPPDPKYPKGVDIDISNGHPFQFTCQADLPYPAPRCGQYLIRCSRCGWQGIVTTAGRPDDPRSIKIPCLIPIDTTVRSQ